MIDSSSSTSTVLAPTANALNTVSTVANAALTTTALTTAVNMGTAATGAVSVGVSGQNLTLQGISNPIALQLAFSDEVTALTTANLVYMRAPFGFNVRSGTMPLFMLTGLGTAGTTTFDIVKNATSIYSTRPSITYYASPTNAQYTSSANPGTLSSGGPRAFTQFDKITVQVYSAGTGMVGAKCIIFAS